MATTKEMLLSYLEGLGVTFQMYVHPTVMTVEEQAKYIGHLEGAQSKNLFLKDKKGRLYLVSALPATNVDLKVLSQRLGLGKGGLRMAPEEALQEVLKVPLGCVTPFALINNTARSVALLLDQKFRSYERVFFHPLSNDSTIALTNSDVDVFLRSIEREASYIDLEAVVTVGKDQPPDLARYVPSTSDHGEEIPKPKPNQAVASLHDNSSSENSMHAVSKSMAEQVVAVSTVKSKKKIVEKPIEEGQLRTLLQDPQNLVNHIIDETVGRVFLKIEAEIGHPISKDVMVAVSKKTKEQLTPDIENIIMLFKNTAYTEGFKSGVSSQSLRRL